MNELNGNFYKPENYELKVVDCKAGFKFCDDIMLSKSFLDQQGKEYDESELEMTIIGWAIRIKKDKSN